jgi:2-amino-4-hydroxy-6-hydroxymethyldihydropteridine diphosphokinase
MFGTETELTPILSTAYIGIGSNVGDSRANCLRAVEALHGLPNSRMIKVSSLYHTEPVGYENQNWFVNCALMLETGLSPHELLKIMQDLEKAAGRTRVIPGGPRTLDLDLLFYGSIAIQEDTLCVPHPELIHRRFVLEPLREIDPDKIHPQLKKTVEELYLALSDDKRVCKILR